MTKDILPIMSSDLLVEISGLPCDSTHGIVLFDGKINLDDEDELSLPRPSWGPTNLPRRHPPERLGKIASGPTNALAMIVCPILLVVSNYFLNIWVEVQHEHETLCQTTTLKIQIKQSIVIEFEDI